MSGYRAGQGSRRSGVVGMPHAMASWEVYRQAILCDVAQAAEKLKQYGQETDEPAPGAVEAADLLDSAKVALDGDQ